MFWYMSAGIRPQPEVDDRPVRSAGSGRNDAAPPESSTLRLRRAETARLEHLHFVDSLDRVNSVVLSTNDLESMASDVLEAVLSIFDCDRAWLVFPCDPDAEFWQVPMEKTRPEYPGLHATGAVLPMDPERAAIFSMLLEVKGPVAFGPGTVRPLPSNATQLGFRSGLAMALFPKVGLPWIFGLHQCSSERTWTPEEIKLLEQIGRRLTDGLTSLLTHRDLQRSEREFRTLAENSPDLIARFDHEGRYLYVNTSLARLANLTPAQFMGAQIGEAAEAAGRPLSSEGLERVRAAVRDALRTGLPQQYEGLAPTASGEVVFEFRIVPERDEAGEVASALCIGRDVTERQRAAQAQRRLIRSLRLISTINQQLIHAPDETALLEGVCRLIVEVGGHRLAWLSLSMGAASEVPRPVARFSDSEGIFDGLDRSIPDALWSKGPGALVHAGADALVVPDIAADERMSAWREVLLTRGLQSLIAVPLRDARGTVGSLVVFASAPRSFPPEEAGLMQELAGDVTFGLRALRTCAEHWVAEQKLSFLALHDPLTRLPNRLKLRERFEVALSVARERQGRLALLFLDLDNFKEINDSLGHEVGDRLLLQVAERLQACVPNGGIVAREGGDEFLILLTDPGDGPAIEQQARELLRSIDQPMQVGETMLQSTASVGISVFPDDGTDFEALRRNSDAALFHAKDGGRNTYRFFNERMNLDALARVEMQTRLRHALRNKAFRLHYQPQLQLSDRRIVAVEALMRWRDADGQDVPPGTFIPVAERSGLIIPMGRWVLEEACRQAESWRQAGLGSVMVAVNLSVVQFARGDVVQDVSEALRSSGLPATLLELEITETVLLQETDSALRTLQALKDLGVRLSIDDFGTGYSSLAYLKRLPVHKLKIAHPFVKQAASSREDAAIVRAIIQLGHTLGLEVIAEGVEVQAQLEFLRGNGCDLVQGYLISRPLPAEELPRLLRLPPA